MTSANYLGQNQEHVRSFKSVFLHENHHLMKPSNLLIPYTSLASEENLYRLTMNRMPLILQLGSVIVQWPHHSSQEIN